jgi:hypothetical protein
MLAVQRGSKLPPSTNVNSSRLTSIPEVNARNKYDEQKSRGFTLIVVTDNFRDTEYLSNSTFGNRDKRNSKGNKRGTTSEIKQ